MMETTKMPKRLSEQQAQNTQIEAGGQLETRQLQAGQEGGRALSETSDPAASPDQGPFEGPAPALEPVQKMSQMRELVMDYGASQQAAQFFKTFADGTRLRLLQALSVRELCVSDLCALLEVSQPAVSNHLRVLSNLHIVKSRRSGKNIFYSLDDWHINAIIGMALEHLSMGAAQAW